MWDSKMISRSMHAGCSTIDHIEAFPRISVRSSVRTLFYHFIGHDKLFRVRVYTLINTVNRAVTTIPLDKVNNHFSDRVIIYYK